MRYMFTMMNNARLSVGLQGLAVAEVAYQQAVAYARERRQGRAPASAGRRVEPDHRPRRRAADAADHAVDHRGDARPAVPQRRGRRPQPHAPDEETRDAQPRAGRAAHAGVEGVVHRHGHGPRPPGDAGPRRDGVHRGDRHRPARARHPDRRHLRGDQRDPGHGPRGPQAPHARRRGGEEFLQRIEDVSRHPRRWSAPLGDAVAALREATTWILAHGPAGRRRLRAATPYLRMFGMLLGGWVMARQAPAPALGMVDAFVAAKAATAEFYCTELLPQAAGLLPGVRAGAARCWPSAPRTSPAGSGGVLLGRGAVARAPAARPQPLVGRHAARASARRARGPRGRAVDMSTAGSGGPGHRRPLQRGAHGSGHAAFDAGPGRQEDPGRRRRRRLRGPGRGPGRGPAAGRPGRPTGPGVGPRAVGRAATGGSPAGARSSEADAMGAPDLRFVGRPLEGPGPYRAWLREPWPLVDGRGVDAGRAGGDRRRRQQPAQQLGREGLQYINADLTRVPGPAAAGGVDRARGDRPPRPTGGRRWVGRGCTTWWGRSGSPRRPGWPGRSAPAAERPGDLGSIGRSVGPTCPPCPTCGCCSSTSSAAGTASVGDRCLCEVEVTPEMLGPDGAVRPSILATEADMVGGALANRASVAAGPPDRGPDHAPDRGGRGRDRRDGRPAAQGRKRTIVVEASSWRGAASAPRGVPRHVHAVAQPGGRAAVRRATATPGGRR